MADKERRPQLWDDNATIEMERGCPINLRGFKHFIINAAQACQEHGHHKPAGLPNPRQNNGIDGKIAALDPIEIKAFPIPKGAWYFRCQCQGPKSISRLCLSR